MDAYSENLSKKEQTFGNSGTLAQEIQSGFVEKRWPGLLPTPQAMEDKSNPETWDARAAMKKEEGINLQLGLTTMARKGFLPTPNSRDFKDPENPEKYEKRKQDWAEKGINLQLTLPQAIVNGMLPTPTSTDYKGAYSPEAMVSKDGIDRSHLLRNVYIHTEHSWKDKDGKTSQLNPLFVAEMMSFPPDYTVLPFLNGERKA